MNKYLEVLFNQLYHTIFFKQIGRPNKLEIAHYFKIWYFVLETGIHWRRVKGPLSWSTYYKKFTALADIGFFKLLHTCALKIAQKDTTLSKDHLKTLFVDATQIKNINGVVFLGKNRVDRNRKGNKLTLIIAQNGMPLAISLTTANQSDLRQLVPTINQIQ